VLAAGGLDSENSNVKISRIVLIFGQFMFILAPTISLQDSNSDLKKIFRVIFLNHHFFFWQSWE
jgi:hypothetical protein